MVSEYEAREAERLYYLDRDREEAELEPLRDAAPVVYHVRAKLARLGGGSFYRDQRVRPTGTLCGAPVTDHDILPGRRPPGDWTRNDGQRFEACAECGRRIL